jgi:hypothetical protein
MQIGYMQASKAMDRRAPISGATPYGAAGVATRRPYEDRASCRLAARPGLDAALRPCGAGTP